MESRLGVCADTTGGVHPLWVVNISLATTTFLGDSAHIDQRINQLVSSRVGHLPSKPGKNYSKVTVTLVWVSLSVKGLNLLLMPFVRVNYN